MANNGEDITWRKTLGDDRKIIGDFACYVHCILGIQASKFGVINTKGLLRNDENYPCNIMNMVY